LQTELLICDANDIIFVHVVQVDLRVAAIQKCDPAKMTPSRLDHI